VAVVEGANGLADMACDICHATGKEVFVCETWSGSWHSACNHAACATCLRGWIEAALPECKALQQVRVPCFAADCKKALPQRLVLQISKGARMFADLIDEQCPLPDMQLTSVCPSCSLERYLLENIGCGHLACEDCWDKWAAEQLEGCRAECKLRLCCYHPGCQAPVATSFWHEELASSRAVAELTDAMDAEFDDLSQCGALRPAGPTEPGPICPVCREQQVALLHDELSSSCCGHMACRRCWATWTEEHLERCTRERSVAVRCLWPECGEMISQRFWHYLCTASERVHEVQRRLERRHQLQQNTLYPVDMQVNCPRAGCVGLGYLGFDTVMCFLCEHQWAPEMGAGEAPHTDAEQIMGLEVKRCPSCQEYIEKNGGCNHMTCVCKHQFFWSSLQAYRASGA